MAASGYRRIKLRGADLSLLKFCVILVEIQFEKQNKTKQKTNKQTNKQKIVTKICENLLPDTTTVKFSSYEKKFCL